MRQRPSIVSVAAMVAAATMACGGGGRGGNVRLPVAIKLGGNFGP